MVCSLSFHFDLRPFSLSFFHFTFDLRLLLFTLLYRRNTLVPSFCSCLNVLSLFEFQHHCVSKYIGQLSIFHAIFAKVIVIIFQNDSRCKLIKANNSFILYKTSATTA